MFLALPMSRQKWDQETCVAPEPGCLCRDCQAYVATFNDGTGDTTPTVLPYFIDTNVWDLESFAGKLALPITAQAEASWTVPFEVIEDKPTSLTARVDLEGDWNDPGSWNSGGVFIRRDEEWAAFGGVLSSKLVVSITDSQGNAGPSEQLDLLQTVLGEQDPELVPDPPYTVELKITALCKSKSSVVAKLYPTSQPSWVIGEVAVILPVDVTPSDPMTWTASMGIWAPEDPTEDEGPNHFADCCSPPPEITCWERTSGQLSAEFVPPFPGVPNTCSYSVKELTWSNANLVCSSNGQSLTQQLPDLDLQDGYLIADAPIADIFGPLNLRFAVYCSTISGTLKFFALDANHCFAVFNAFTIHSFSCDSSGNIDVFVDWDQPTDNCDTGGAGFFRLRFQIPASVCAVADPRIYDNFRAQACGGREVPECPPPPPPIPPDPDPIPPDPQDYLPCGNVFVPPAFHVNAGSIPQPDVSDPPADPAEETAVDCCDAWRHNALIGMGNTLDPPECLSGEGGRQVVWPNQQRPWCTRAQSRSGWRLGFQVDFDTQTVSASLSTVVWSNIITTGQGGMIWTNSNVPATWVQDPMTMEWTVTLDQSFTLSPDDPDPMQEALCPELDGWQPTITPSKLS